MPGTSSREAIVAVRDLLLDADRLGIPTCRRHRRGARVLT